MTAKSNKSGKITVIVLGVLTVVIVSAVILVFDYFAPVVTTDVDQPLSAADGWTEGLPVLATGKFTSADGAHEVSGRVSVYRGTHGLILRFEDYQTTSGPALYVFSSSSPKAQFDEAWVNYVRFAGGQEDGMASLRGNFNATLDPEIQLDDLKSLIVHCERLGVTFGSAQLALEGTGH